MSNIKFCRKPAEESNQLILDLGQKYFGPILCKQCGFLYTASSKQDEKLHNENHKRLTSSIKFPKILAEFCDGQIVEIDPKDHSNNLKEIRLKVDAHLGTNRKNELKNEKAYQYCNKLINSSPNKVMFSINTYECLSIPVKAICGINQIWTDPLYKKKKIATRLINIVLNNFYYGYVMSKQEIAFSCPTLEGMKFIKAYMNDHVILMYNNA